MADGSEGERSALVGLQKRQDRAFATFRSQRDDVLESLATLGRSGISVAVGMVVDGVTMTGAIGRPTDFAAAVEQAARPALEALGWEADLVEELATMLREAPGRRAELVGEMMKVLERYAVPLRIDDIAASDVADVYGALRDEAFVDLHGVRIFGTEPGAMPTSVHHMRVRTEHISAWWPLASQEGADIRYAGPAADGESVRRGGGGPREADR